MNYLLSVLLLVLSLCAQTVTVENCSDRAQFGWADFTLPASVEVLPGTTYGPAHWPVYYRRQFGDIKLYSIWAVSIPGRTEVVHQLNLVPTDQDYDPPPFIPCPWVMRDIPGLFPSLVVKGTFGTHTFTNRLPKLIESNAVCQIYKVKSEKWKGLQAVWYITIRSYQAQVHIDATINWTDPTVQAYALEGLTSIQVKSRYEYQHWFEKKEGVKHEHHDYHWWTTLLYNEQAMGRVGDGEQYRLRGTLHTEPSDAERHEHGPVSGEPGDVEHGRAEELTDMWLINLLASRTGPLMAVSHSWDGHWGPTGAIPVRPDEATNNRPRQTTNFKKSLRDSGSMWDERPHAGAKSSGATGAQAGFGVVKSGRAVTNHEAGFIWQLFYSEGLEHGAGYHYTDIKGRRVLQSDHPKWATWNRYTDHRNSSDNLGKDPNGRSWADRKGVSHVTGDDDQHFNTLYNLDLYALTGDWMLLELLRDGIEVDLAQALSRHNPYDPSGVGRAGAARAIGRLLQNWSWQYALMDGSDKAKTLENIKRRIRNAKDKFMGSGVVKVQDTVTDNRVIPGVEAWMPWQQAICVGGYWAAFRRTGDRDAFTLATDLSASMTLWTTSKNPSGLYVPYTGIAYNGGQPLSQDAYSTGDKALLKYNGTWTQPSMGWWEWTLQGIIPMVILPTTPELKARALSIYNQQNSRKSWKQVEWFSLK